MSDPSPAIQFHLAEYETLRGELEFLNGQLYSIGLYAIISVGAIWAWLAVNHAKVRGTKLIWWLPFFLCVVTDAWVVLVCFHMQRIVGYLRKIEAAMPHLPGLSGWHSLEHWQPSWWRISVWVLWGLIFATTFLAPFYFLRRLEKHHRGAIHEDRSPSKE